MNFSILHLEFKLRAKKFVEKRLNKSSRVIFQWDPRCNIESFNKGRRIGKYGRETSLEIIALRREQFEGK